MGLVDGWKELESLLGIMSYYHTMHDFSHTIVGLQSRSTQSTVAPSMAILEKLKEEMRNLRDIKKSIEPIGKFVLPSGSSQTGINTDHVDF